jgi:hypothetical protein
MKVSELRKILKKGGTTVKETSLIKEGQYDATVMTITYLGKNLNNDNELSPVVDVKYKLEKRYANERIYLGWLFKKTKKTGEDYDPEMQKRNFHNFILKMFDVGAFDEETLDEVMEIAYDGADELSSKNINMKLSIDELMEIVNKTPKMDITLLVKVTKDGRNNEYAIK